MGRLSDGITRGFREVFDWLAAHSIAPTGPPFVRYLRVDMEGELEIEVAAPADAGTPTDGKLRAGVLPAGRYVTLIHVGSYDGLAAANAALQQWARERALTWQIDDGAVWGARLERYLTDPSQQPDPSSWQTELAYLVRDP